LLLEYVPAHAGSGAVSEGVCESLGRKLTRLSSGSYGAYIVVVVPLISATLPAPRRCTRGASALEQEPELLLELAHTINVRVCVCVCV
jgi:hypothetical protein